jgi:hypothetical protein
VERQDIIKLRFQAFLNKGLLNVLLAMGALFLLANVEDVNAAEASIKVIQNAILKDDLIMQFRAEEIFTEKVIKFLNRGFTVRVDYNIELWRRRKFWFDSLDEQHNVSYQINFEPLEKRYIWLKSENETITSKLERQLDKIVRWTTLPEPPLVIAPVGKLASSAEYYYSIEITIATLTAENIRDLQKWLGEFGEEEEEPSTLTKTSFRVAADFLSSRNHKKLSARSERFRLSSLPKLDD